MTRLLLFVLMFAAGIALAVQPSVNARLARRVGVIESSCISFLVGTIALALLAAVAGKGGFRGVAEARWWELTGGLLGAFFVTLTIIAVPRIGTAAVMAAAIAAQLSTGLLMDHFGLFGFPQIPAEPRRLAGALLLLAGAALVFRR